MDINREAFRLYAYWAGVLGVKMLGMVPITAFHRFTKKIFANPEDAAMLPNATVNLSHPSVERVRRAHLNDMENILPFFTLGFLYCFTNPSVATAGFLFKSFAITRILHTLVYAIWVLPQPARVLSFGVGFMVNAYMAFNIISHFC